MNKKRIIMLCFMFCVVVCFSFICVYLTEDNLIATNINKHAAENVINNAVDNTVENQIISAEENTTVTQETTRNVTSNEKNTNKIENKNTNTNTVTKEPTKTIEKQENISQEIKEEVEPELKKPIVETKPEVPTINYGDINEDGKINSADVILIRRYIGNTQKFNEKQLLVADVNKDGVIDFVDIDVLRKFIIGDINKLPYNTGKKYSITYELNGGVVSKNNILRNAYTSISEIETLPKLIKDNYVFIGWTGSNGNIPELTVTPKSSTAQNLYYIANWKLYGDVNEDNKITSGDLIYIRQYISGNREFTEIQELVADVNIDSKIDENDIEILRKFIVGKYGIDKLPYN